MARDSVEMTRTFALDTLMRAVDPEQAPSD